MAKGKKMKAGKKTTTKTHIMFAID